MSTKPFQVTAIDEWCAGHVADMLGEFYRIDTEVWGHPLDAAIIRCIAATQWKTGRSARVSSIANTLNASVTTVHDRVGRLSAPVGAASKAPCSLIMRTPDGGYKLTPASEPLVREALIRLSAVMDHYRNRVQSKLVRRSETVALNTAKDR
jgi:hypothetical protein